MEHEGPILEALMRRLAECPVDFHGQPLDTAGKGNLDVAALVWDLMHEVGGRALPSQEVAVFLLTPDRPKKRVNQLMIVSTATWLFYDPWFRGRPGLADSLRSFLFTGLKEFADHVAFTELMSDPDRREELVRLALRVLNYRPAGETRNQAKERLVALDSAERARVMKASREAEERSRKIREEAARKAAEEAASNYGRE